MLFSPSLRRPFWRSRENVQREPTTPRRCRVYINGSGWELQWFKDIGFVEPAGPVDGFFVAECAEAKPAGSDCPRAGREGEK